MFKKTQKIFAILTLMLVLMATTCFATDDTAVVTSETSEDVDVILDDSATEEEHNHEDEATTEAEEQELYEEDLYIFENTVSVKDLIDGNAYVIGSDVTVSGKIAGDLFVIADNVSLTLDSYVNGNLFVCANTVNIEGIVYDLYAIGNELTISDTGIVLRDMRTMNTSLTINGSVGRNTYVKATNLSVGEDARIYGDFNYSTKEAIQVPSGVVDGSINYSENVSVETEGSDVLSYVMSCVYSVVYTLAILGILIVIAPKFLEKLPKMFSKKSLSIFGIGLLGLIVPVPLAILLMITVIGTPVAFALLAVWAFIVFALSSAITTIAISSWVGNKVAILGKAHNLLAVVLVSIVLWALSLIPIVKTIVSFLVCVFGLGYLLTYILKRNKEENV